MRSITFSLVGQNRPFAQIKPNPERDYCGFDTTESVIVSSCEIQIKVSPDLPQHTVISIVLLLDLRFCSISTISKKQHLNLPLQVLIWDNLSFRLIGTRSEPCILPQHQLVYFEKDWINLNDFLQLIVNDCFHTGDVMFKINYFSISESSAKDSRINPSWNSSNDGDWCQHINPFNRTC